MSLSISKTPALRRLLSRIGSSTYRFNTVLVGLKCVADGYGDGGSIAVTWSKPSEGLHAKHVSAQAQSFACAAVVVLAADVFDSYIREITNEDWLGFKSSTREIATKAITRSKDQGGAYSVAERAESLQLDLGIGEIIPLALIELFAKWRNVMAHSEDRAVRLDRRMRDALMNNAEEIGRTHSHLSIKLAIENYESRAVPVAKEVTSLMANAVRFARAIDEAAIRRVASTTIEAETAAHSLLKRYFCDDPERAKRIVADMWQGDMLRRTSALSKLLSSVGVSASSKPVSALLSANYVGGLAALSRRQFEDMHL